MSNVKGVVVHVHVHVHVRLRLCGRWGCTWGGTKTTKTTKTEQTDNNQGKKVKSICAVRESNPKLNLGRVSCYHYTNGAGDDDAAFLRNTY